MICADKGAVNALTDREVGPTGQSPWRAAGTDLGLVTPAEDGFDRWKGIYKLLDFHAVTKDHCRVGC